MRISEVASKTRNTAVPNSWRVDRDAKTIFLDNGYTLTFEGRDQAWHIKDANGNETRIWGDPHVQEKDGGRWEFRDQMTFQLADGTKITVKTIPVGNGRATVSDQLFITKGDQSVHVTGLAANRVVISGVTSNGRAMDARVTDGYVAMEMGGVDDWSVNGREVTRDILRGSPEILLERLAPFTTPPPRETLPADYGTRHGESIGNRLADLENSLNSSLREYRGAMNRPLFQADRKFFEDLINATQEDLNELRRRKNTGSREDRVRLYNQLTEERHLEVKYNINLTQQGTEWSTADLADLDEQLDRLPRKFTVLDENLRTIRLQAMQPGQGGFNTNSGLIALPPGGIEWALIHEVGHDFDNENPDWSNFMALSGWRDSTGSFRNISGDYVDGVYRPMEGSATLSRDGRVYHDGDRVDLDGDGLDDGVVEVHYGKVMIRNEQNSFVSDYATVGPLEDFAETFRFFFTDPSGLNEVSEEKYQFMVRYAGVDPLN